MAAGRGRPARKALESEGEVRRDPAAGFCRHGYRGGWSEAEAEEAAGARQSHTPKLEVRTPPGPCLEKSGEVLEGSAGGF